MEGECILCVYCVDIEAYHNMNYFIMFINIIDWYIIIFMEGSWQKFEEFAIMLAFCG